MSPINAAALAQLLQGYDTDKVEFLVDGFTNGFRFHFEGDISGRSCNNLKSASEMPDIIDKKLHAELKASRVAGPFPHQPFKNFHASPLGVVPKKEPGKFRLIHHLSHPTGFSINDGIAEIYSSVHYSTIKDAIPFLKLLKNPYMAKTDIESAFRIIPVHPSQWHLLGFKWKGEFFFDKCLPMGLAESCRIFEEFSTALEWAAYTKLNATAVVHVLDDFLFIEEGRTQCQAMLDKFQNMCSIIGVPLAADKTFGPDQIMPFLGITLDVKKMEARLPVDKLKHCQELCKQYKSRQKVTLRDLQSLIGTLQFATSVVLPGRAFLRRLIDLTINVQKPNFKIRLSAATRADLTTWESFLDEFNGCSFFLEEQWLTSHTLKLYTDSSSTIGFGAVFRNSWFYGTWAKPALQHHITALELYPILAALFTWGHQFSNHCLWLYTDNMSLVSILNKQSSRDKVIMKMIRPLVLFCLRNNILIRASHIDGVKNTLADALSRSQIKRFRMLLPTADRYPTPVPPQVDQDLFFKP